MKQMVTLKFPMAFYPLKRFWQRFATKPKRRSHLKHMPQFGMGAYICVYTLQPVWQRVLRPRYFQGFFEDRSWLEHGAERLTVFMDQASAKRDAHFLGPDHMLFKLWLPPQAIVCKGDNLLYLRDFCEDIHVQGFYALSMEGIPFFQNPDFTLLSTNKSV